MYKIMKHIKPSDLLNFWHKVQYFVMLAFIIFLTLGLWYAFFNSPEDYLQGETVRIMYIHVPSAWLALGIYSMIALFSTISFIFKSRILFICSIAAAPIGACFALVTLISGSIWGKPIWGTWWVWDARLTSMLILFFFYIGYISLASNSNDLLRLEKPLAVIAILGFINVPIVKFSVEIWHTLHQSASILRRGGVSIHPSMLKPLIMMFIAFSLYFIIILFMRIETILNKLKIKKINL